MNGALKFRFQHGYGAERGGGGEKGGGGGKGCTAPGFQTLTPSHRKFLTFNDHESTLFIWTSECFFYKNSLSTFVSTIIFKHK